LLWRLLRDELGTPRGEAIGGGRPSSALHCQVIGHFDSKQQAACTEKKPGTKEGGLERASIKRADARKA